ncbi:hypothetical protein KAZ66_03875 [Candidatus Woesebacteria bacterium]|jgi:tRNA U54 and U55 pseudouridine synthase Pus10|nr:hypothetical protein [Patescibacteria group bacterium]MBP7967387.1 hypothetical protein [Candidatus Woesebacteria bacterium]
MSFESKNSLEANEKDELKEVQKELKELKDIFVVCKTPADLLKVMPDKRSDKHVYQLKVNNVNYSFHGNGYVYQLNNE